MAESKAYYYHYSNGTALVQIHRDQRLNISRSHADTKWGHGLYLTVLTPDHHTDAELLANNYGNSHKGKCVSDVEYYFKLPKKRICEKLEAVPPHDRSLFRIPDKGIDLSGMSYAVGRRSDAGVMWEMNANMLTEERLQELIPDIRTQEKEMGGKAGGKEMPALGRPFELGMLYNYRTEELHAGKLWESDQMKDFITSNKCDIGWQCLPIAGDSIDAKMEAFGIQSNLKMSMLSGLVPPSEGAAEYLWDRCPSNKTARASVLCREYTLYEGLETERVGGVSEKNRKVALESDATHIVTGITYGSQAVYTFERTVKDSEAKAKEETVLAAKIEKVFGVDIESHDDTVPLHWKYFGEEPYATESRLHEASTHYQQVTRQSNTKPQPIKVWLTPLGSMRMNAVTSVNHTNEVDTQAILEDLAWKKADCHDLLQSVVCEHSQKVHDDLTKLVQLLDTFTTAFTEKVARLVPQIRGNATDSEELHSVIDEACRSPFLNDSPRIRPERRKDGLGEFDPHAPKRYGLHTWLEHKKDAVKKLEIYIAKMAVIPFEGVEKHRRPESDAICLRVDSRREVYTEHAVNDEIAGQMKPCMCFSFFEGTLEDRFLGGLEACFGEHKESTGNTMDLEQTKHDPEYNKDESLNVNDDGEANGWPGDIGRTEEQLANDAEDDTGERIERFLEFYENNTTSDLKFVATFTGEEAESHRSGSTIRFYKKGQLVYDNFQPPSAVGEPTEETHSIVCLKWNEPDCGRKFVKGYQVWRKYGDADWFREGETGEPRTTAFDVTKDRDYIFRVRAVSQGGYFGPYGPASKPVHTLQSACDSNRLAAENEKAMAAAKSLKDENKNLKERLDAQGRTMAALKTENDNLKAMSGEL